ncbi:MAG: LpqB family beta-propeller domain-containing protein [Pseudonocardiales bacterium]
MGSRLRRFALPTLVAIGAMLAAACSDVPSHSHAVRVRGIAPGVADADPEVRQQPRTAAPGDTPERVVRGFLAAGKSAQDRHAIARTYLAPSAASWNDLGPIRIVAVAGERVILGPTTTRVVVSGHYQARLDNDLAYVPDDRALTLDLVLTRTEGQWRITNPPPGVLLPTTDFQAVYKPLDLYFLAPGGNTVIPDKRYFDVKQAVLPTQMATRLLAGPSAWLTPGVRTAFPPGTRLRSNVIRDGDLFVVDLSVEVLAASRGQQSELAAQLVWTLAKQFSVSGVRILADGRPLRVRNQSGDVPRDAYASYNPRVLTSVVAGYYLAGGAVRTTTEPGTADPPTPPATGLTTAAISADLGTLAGVRRRGPRMELAIGPAQGLLTPRLVATSVTRPTWEPSADAVFVALNDGSIRRVGTDGGLATVGAPRPAALRQVTALALSRDGVRMGVVAGPPGHRRLLLAVLSRTGTRISLSGLRDVAPSLTDVIDVTWADEDHVLVIARRVDGPAEPYGLTLDGASISEQPTSGLPGTPTRVAAAPGEPDLVEAGGRIWRRQGSLWESPVEGGARLAGSAPFYPG